MNGGKATLMVNANPGRWLISRRGVRQGDLLSPLLFVLVVDVFTRMINLATSANLIQGLGPAGYEKKVITIQYVDDTLIFRKVDRHQLTDLKLALYGFGLVSGLRINFDKSSVIILEDNDVRQR